MKKLISILLSILMVLPFICFAEANSNEPINVALGKSYTAPEAIRGYTANLTDGEVATEFEVASPKWYGLFWNDAAADRNCISETISIKVDLGGYYDISKIRVHTMNADANYSIGIPSNISVFAYASPLSRKEICERMPIGQFFGIGDVWLECNVDVIARYVEFNITKEDYCHWLMLNEIEIYGIESDYVPVEDSDVNKPNGENIALNKSYEAPKAIRGYTANLTDGIASYDFQAGTPHWYGLFCNPAASDSNAPAGKESIIIDLGNYYDLTAVRMHSAGDGASSVSLPIAVEIFVCAIPEEGFVSLGEIENIPGKDGVYWLKSLVDSECVRYVRLDISLGDYWAMLDEIEVYGTPSEKGVSYMLGDINGDSYIGAKDYVALKRYFFGGYEFTEEQSNSVDINQDGKLDAKDYAALKRACFGIYEIQDLNSYKFSIQHEGPKFETDHRLGDLLHLPEGDIAVLGNSFLWTSGICEQFCELSSNNGQTRQLINYSDYYMNMLDATFVQSLEDRGIAAVFFCGLYSSADLEEFMLIYENCEMAGIELVLLPAHNENRMLISAVSKRCPDIYVLDWKAEIDMLIESGIDRWDMCVDDAHDHSTPLAGYVGAHMIYRAVYGEIPDNIEVGGFSYSYLKSMLGNYVETGIIE